MYRRIAAGPGRTHCFKGHPLAAAGVYVRLDFRRWRVEIRCRRCTQGRDRSRARLRLVGRIRERLRAAA